MTKAKILTPKVESQAKSLPPTSPLDPIEQLIQFGSVNLVAGASGVGKTILLAEVMSRIRTGRTAFGHKTHPQAGYGIIVTDRDWKSTYATIYKQINFPEIERYVLSDDKDYDPQDWKKAANNPMAKFKDCLERLKAKVGSLAGWLIFIDSFTPLFIWGSSRDERDVALSLHWVRKMGKEYGVTFVLFGHVAKQKADGASYTRPQDRISGSGAFVAYSDCQFSIEQDAEGKMTCYWNPRLSPPGQMSFKFNVETGLFAPYQADPNIQIQMKAVLTDGEGKCLSEKHVGLYELIPSGSDGIHKNALLPLATEKLKIKQSRVYLLLKHLVALGYLRKGERAGIWLRAEKVH